MQQSNNKKRGKNAKNKPKVAPKKATVIGGRVKAQSGDLSGPGVRYLKSIIQPCSGNARIPDLNTVPTVLYTYTTEGTLASGNNGAGGLRVTVGMVPGMVMESPTSTDGLIAFNTSIVLSDLASSLQNYSFCRPVSACLDVWYVGSDYSNQGVITGYSNTSFSGAQESAPTTYTGVLAMRCSDTYRLKEGASTFYRPSDSSAFLFRAPTSTITYGDFGVHLSGAVASTTVCRYRFTINYECVVANDTSTFGTADPSPVDPASTAKAVSIASRVKPIYNHNEASWLTKAMQSVANNWETVVAVANTAKNVAKFVA